jgi:hypothetical protein
MLSMKLIASREMAAKPAALWKALKKEGAVVVTKNGQPEGVLLSTSGETWLEDVQEVIFARARRAASNLRKAASKSGAAALSEEEIEAEIGASRRERRK